MKVPRLIALSALALYVILQYFPLPHGGLFGIIHSLVSLFVLVLLPGIGVALGIELVRKKAFITSEFLAVVSACSLFIIPLIVLTSLTIVPFRLAHLPLLLCSGISCILLSRNRALATKTFERKDTILLVAISFLLLCIWTACHMYYPLPDRDPYSWLSRYLSFLTAYTSGNLGLSDRPGFFAFLFLYNALARIDAYALLKYVLPLLYAACLFPVWMIARRFNTIWSVVALTTVCWSASTMLYAMTPMPQMLFISAMFFSISFLLYARITGEKFYRYIAGLIFLVSIPLYEGAVIVFLTWLIFQCWHERRAIHTHFLKNPLALILFILLVITNLPFLLSKSDLIFSWTGKLAEFVSHHSFNMLFPAQYTNVDGNAVGWAGVSGVVKYYSYYVGLPIIFLMGVGGILVFFKRWRIVLLQELRTYPETQIAISIFLLFFTISELFPRLINFALLPERAWIMGGIAFIYPALLFLPQLPKRLSSPIAWCILLLVIPNIAGAMYVNYQKQFLITEQQLESASWIQENLPPDRTIISDIHGNLLTFYSHSPVALQSPLFCNSTYKDSTVFLSAITASKEVTDTNQNIEETLVSIRNSILQAKPLNKEDIASVLLKYANEPITATPAPMPIKRKGHYYIYYSSDNPHDPYKKRPYTKERELCDTFVFDENPSHYERIYQHENNIIIWAVK